MPTVELVFDDDCPNVPAAREQLERAFAMLDLEPVWRELVNGRDELPEYARGFGSPTVLVEKRDVLGAEPGGSSCCRIYRDSDGALVGVPTVDQIAHALRPHMETGGGQPDRTWRTSLAVVPSVLLALLPQVACPSCWPVYAGVLSTMGLGFLMSTTYLLPLTAVSLVIALFALAWRARTRRGYGPLALGLLASVGLMIGKFAFESDVAMFVGVGGLLAASLWNSWPRAERACPAEPTSA